MNGLAAESESLRQRDAARAPVAVEASSRHSPLLALLAVNETGEALDAVGDIIPDLPVGKGKTPSPPESFVADFFLRNPMVCFGSQKNVGCNRRLLNVVDDQSHNIQ